MASKARELANLGNAYSDGALSNRNKILNGAMVIDQRNGGSSVTPNNSYTVDRWGSGNTQTGKFTAQQNAGSVTPPAGFVKYLGITSSSAYSVLTGDTFFIQQIIEGNNVSDLAWGTANAKTITISFWVRSSLTGTFGGALENADQNRTYVFSYTISSANTWEYKTITVVGDTGGTWTTTNAYGIGVRFGLGSGSTYTGTAGSWGAGNLVQPTGSVSVVGTSGATFYITGVQLEVGDTATPFEHRSYGQELALCQRYYQLNVAMSGFTYTTTQISVHTSFATEMRAAPSVALFNGTSAAVDVGAAIRDINGIGGTDLSNKLGNCLNLSISGTANLKYHTIRGGVISLDAEL